MDGGPCCTAAFATLPQIPALQTDARFLCFDGCQTSLNKLYCANVGAPIPRTGGGAVICGAYYIRLRLKNCGTTNFVWLGVLNAFYSRTWQESSMPGQLNLQVWRFVVNGDFLPTPNLPNSPCDRPGCLGQYTRVYFSGYVDYAYDCLNGGWQVSFALSHECDSIHHAPGTARPAPASGLHATRSFSIVGPGSTFVPSTTPPDRSDGAITQGSIRWNRWGPAPVACAYREPAQGVFTAQTEYCACGPVGSLNQFIDTQVAASSTCMSSVSPSPVGLFTQKRIGSWTSATQYPGIEYVLFDFGFLSTVDGCNGIVTQEWYEGGETLGGFFAVDPSGVPLGTQFEDLGSSNKTFTNPAFKIGGPHVSNVIAEFTLP